MQSAPPSICTMQNWYFLPNTSFARSETTVTKTALETLPVFLSDPNSAEPKPDQKVTDKFVQNQNSKHRKCLTFSDRRRQNCNRLPNSSFARSKMTVTKTVLENNPVCLSDPNSAEPETDPKRQRKFSGNTDSKHRFCITNHVCDMLSILLCQPWKSLRPFSGVKVW